MKAAMPILTLALCALATAALAQSPAGSNIGLSQYPAPTCQKPVLAVAQPKPLLDEKPSVIEAEGYNRQVTMYNAALKTYNVQMVDFNACIQAYMTNGNADMVRIRDALAAAVAAANTK
jgi:hypothetical protein